MVLRYNAYKYKLPNCFGVGDFRQWKLGEIDSGNSIYTVVFLSYQKLFSHFLQMLEINPPSLLGQ